MLIQSFHDNIKKVLPDFKEKDYFVYISSHYNSQVVKNEEEEEKCISKWMEDDKLPEEFNVEYDTNSKGETVIRTLQNVKEYKTFREIETDEIVYYTNKELFNRYEDNPKKCFKLIKANTVKEQGFIKECYCTEELFTNNSFIMSKRPLMNNHRILICTGCVCETKLGVGKFFCKWCKGPFKKKGKQTECLDCKQKI